MNGTKTAVALVAATIACLSALTGCAVTRDELLADTSTRTLTFDAPYPVATTYRHVVAHARKCFRTGHYVDADLFPDINRATLTMGVATGTSKIAVVDITLSSTAQGSTLVVAKGKIQVMLEDVRKWARDEYGCVGRGE